MKKEEPPYEFKILLFLDNKGPSKQDEKDSDDKKSPNIRDINLQVMGKLSEYGALNIRDTLMNQ